MKKTISALIILLLFLLPAVGNASYLIRLKNGGQLFTPAYWFEDRMILFYCPGGTAGMERSEIDRIETYATEDHPNAASGRIEKKESPQPPPGAEKSPESGKSAEEKAGGKDSPEKLGENSEKKRLLEELRTLEAESAAASEKYHEASELSKQEREEARKEIFMISQKRKKLIEKLQGYNQK